MKKSNVGICDMALYVPKLHLPIEKLAEERNIEFAKLNKGLGLKRMAIPDIHEDAATMAANAVVEIIEKNKLNPSNIGRIYLGTESALDGAKPTATYVLEMLRRKYRAVHGHDCFLNCDVVDLTFACVGAVDALQNTLDWVRGNKNRMGIVVSSDFAKYELESGGEYTQGAGAIAMLIKHNPRLLAIDDIFGVATRGVHDFYKPRRTFSKKDIINEVFQLSNIQNINADQVLSNLSKSLEVKNVLDSNESTIEIYKETPIFDGQYSNWTYQNRIREAYQNYSDKIRVEFPTSETDDHIAQWDRLIFHLPYAYHGKRIASELYMYSLKKQNQWESFSKQLPSEPLVEEYETTEEFEKARGSFLRAITKTTEYKNFVNQKLEKAQRASSLVGNMYACSIFLALMSTLEADHEEGTNLNEARFGFFGYGSGSKSKVFEGQLQPGWKEVVSDFKLFEKLDKSVEIDYSQYEKIHRRQLDQSIVAPNQEFVLERIGKEGVRLGARYYAWKSN